MQRPPPLVSLDSVRHAAPLALLVALAALAAWWLHDPVNRRALDRLLAPPPPPRPAPPPPGGPYTYELIQDPRDRYGPAPITADDLAFAPLIEQAGLVPDPILGHAARELAVFYARHGRLAPGGALAFLLDAAGAPYWGVRQAVLVSTHDDPEPLRAALTGQADGRPGWRAGVGEAILEGSPPRRIRAALVARPAAALDPLSRTAVSGDRVRIAGTLEPDHAEPTAIAAGPDGEVIDLPVTVTDRRFETALTVTPGRWEVELLADGPVGPVPLTQVTLHVDEPVPDFYDGRWPEDPEPAEPAAELHARLNADRLAAGRPPLDRDPALDAIAAAHSAEMRALDYVGHHSPNTGTVADRVAAAGYRAGRIGENVALNRSLDDAQAGLMRSLGHRRNILSTDYTHVGYGAARDATGWYITQVFAEPAPPLADPVAAADDLRARIAAARDRLGLGALRADPRLARAAEDEARRADASPRRAVAAVERLGVTGRVAAWTAALLDPDRLELPAPLLEAGLESIGIGIHRDPAWPLPDVRVVILASD